MRAIPPSTSSIRPTSSTSRRCSGPTARTALAYFRAKIGDDVADTDNQLAAYTLVDLLLRLDRRDEALELACRYLAESADEFGLSLPELCAQSGRLDLLLEPGAEPRGPRELRRGPRRKPQP